MGAFEIETRFLRTHRVRPNTGILAFAAIIVTAALALSTVSVLAAALGLTPFLAVWFIWRLVGGRRERGTVRFTMEGVAFDHEIESRDRLRSVFFVPGSLGRGGQVVLRGPSELPIAEIDVRGRNDFLAIEKALELPPPSEVTQIEGAASPAVLSGKALWLVMLAGFALSGLAGLHHDGWLGTAGIVLIFLGPILFSSARFYVGVDGVRLVTRLEDRFVPWAEVTLVERSWTGVRLRSRRGTTSLPVTTRFFVGSDAQLRRQSELLQRCEAYFGISRREAPVDAASLERRSHSRIGRGA